MEHKSRKMFAAIAVIMLCAVAIVGVGYAYTASTQNGGNTVNAEYINLYQANATTGTGAYTFSESTTINWNSTDAWDASSSKAKTIYKLDGAGEMVDIDGGATVANYTLKQVGDAFVVKANQIGGTPTARTCAITTDIVDPQNYNIILKVVNGTSAAVYMKIEDSNLVKYTDGTGWTTGTGNNTFTIGITSGENPTYLDTTITVYVGYAGDGGCYVLHDAGVAPETGPNKAPVLKPIDEGTLTFTVNTAA